MKNLQFNSYQCEAGWVWSKKFKPISVSRCGAGLKSHLTIFTGQEKPTWDKTERSGSSKAQKNCPS